MNKDKLQIIINELEETNSTQDAYFGIFQNGGGPEESYVHANRQGLELFAAEILKASRDFNEDAKEEEKSTIPLDFESEWIYGLVCIQYVQPYLGSRKKNTPHPERNTLKEKMVGIGCGAILLLIISAVIVGIITIANWLF